MNNNYPSYAERIEQIRRTKQAFTTQKITLRGYNDTDDHGWIPWKPVEFEPVRDPVSGLCTGAVNVGRTLRRWLQIHPLYIHPSSPVAGAWIGLVPGVGAWKDRAVQFRDRWEQYNILFSGAYGMNHFGPDLTIGLELGFGGLLEKIRAYRRQNRPADPSFYDGEEQTVLGIQEFIARHAEYAEELATTSDDAFEQRNYREIADMNRRLIHHPPQTLREAVQFLAWFQTVDRMYFLGGAMGQTDELLLPFYEKDNAEGRLASDDEVVWYFAGLLFNDTHYHQIGGPSATGDRDLANPLSFALLDAMHALKIPSNVALRLHEERDEELLNRAVQYLFEDGTGVSFSCSNGLDNGFVRNGFPLSTARLRAKVGCNWTALPGTEYCLQDVTRLCLVAPFLMALHEMIDDPEEADSLENLWKRYEGHLAVAVETIKEGFDWHVDHKKDNMPELVLNLFCHGPLERGLDISAGGVDIYNLTIDGVGLATVADSFAALELRVVEQERIGWEALLQCLKENYNGQEQVRQMLKNIPRYGTGGSRADRWAKRISACYTDLVKKSPTPRHRLNIIPGLFSHGIVKTLGENLGATPNGRFAGAEISHSADPDPGFLPGGGTAPTAKSSAVAAVQPGWGNSAPLQIDMDSAMVGEAGGLEMVKALLLAHNELGGTLININVVSGEKLLEAHHNPELYPDLVVRVTGYSAYFKSLSPEYRQQVVDRFLAKSA